MTQPFSRLIWVGDKRMTNPPILQAKRINAGYDRGPDILYGANLTVSPGQILCIIGPNGAGKSTLLKTIAGLIKAREGTIPVSYTHLTLPTKA